MLLTLQPNNKALCFSAPHTAVMHDMYASMKVYRSLPLSVAHSALHIEQEGLGYLAFQGYLIIEKD